MSGGISKASHPPWQREKHGKLNCRAQGGGRSADRSPTYDEWPYSVGPWSRASWPRMNASGSEPTYLPLTNTSLAELVLCFLGSANALDAVAITRATASAVLVNMV